MSTQSSTPEASRFTRRVVTGHNEAGRSVIISDGICSANAALFISDFSINEVWTSEGLPADNQSSDAAGPTSVELEPTSGGNIFRIVQFPPDREYIHGIDMEAGFSAIGESGRASVATFDDAPHPAMHRTSTLDYIVIISGEIYAVMEEGEVLLRPGDVLVQRGTNHAWSNRGDQICVMAAVLNSATPFSAL